MNQFKKIIYSLILMFLLVGCTNTIQPIQITNGERIELTVGEVIDLDYTASEMVVGDAVWTSSNSSVIVDEEGIVTARSQGEVVITITIGGYKDTITIKINPSVTVDVKVTLDVKDKLIEVGSTTLLIPTVKPSEYLKDLEYVVTSGANLVTINGNEITAIAAGKVVINARVGIYNSTSIILEIEEKEVEFFEDPYTNMSKEEFYENYVPATSYLDSVYRTEHGFMSGEIGDQDQEPTLSSVRPTDGEYFIKNTSMLYSSDGNTYYVINYKGEIVNEIYKGAAYIMLEEVAAYVYAFGDVPANHAEKKSTRPTESVWGEYLRVNHTKFSGSTTKYPYEPALPNITGIGGDYTYYEMDLGTTGTDCDPSYPVIEYNNGKSIERGAARIVYARFDKSGSLITDPYEKHLFYTYNHYNDFQEYLNYEGGWGEMFGNITGGGKLSSKYDYNPTPYVPVIYQDLRTKTLSLNYSQFEDEHIYVYLPMSDKKYIYC